MGRRALLVSDLDGTLLGDDEALGRFAAWFSQRRADFLLAYASGRFVASVVDSMQSSALPDPDAIIGGVGSEIVSYPSGLPIWSPGGASNGTWKPNLVQDALCDVADLRLQPKAYQSSYKVSFYLDDTDPRRLDEIRQRLRDAAVSANIIYSSNRDLDVLPAGVSKGSAVGRLASWAGIEHDDIIVAGDTGNDRSMFECGYRGIVVANAESALRSLTGKSVYHTRGRYASGVLEGVEHWLSEQDRYESSRSSIPKGHRGPAHECHRTGIQRL